MHEVRICYAKKGADYAIEEFILFGKYRVLSVLGTGSYSTVYLAEHLKLKVLRAIKRIPKATASGLSFSTEDGTPMEAALLKNLNHPGIPLIYDIDEDDEFIYMFEEYIQGESLDTFVIHQENISEEQIVEFGIQLCDILDYLHHLSPYPILYQDLKPEHIILCGNQLKLIDFGIASYFTGSGKHFQHYGTKGFAAPEACNGLPTTPSADIYSLGRILDFLTDHVSSDPSPQLLRIITQATSEIPSERYETAACLKAALKSAATLAYGQASHLIKNIAVIGSRPGAGATHFAVALVSALNKYGLHTIYLSADSRDTLDDMTSANPHLTERNGIYYYEYFEGIPDYGSGIELPLPSDCCFVRDYGTHQPDIDSFKDIDLIFYIASGSDWDFSSAVKGYRQISAVKQTIFVCNYHNKKAAAKYAGLFGKKVYCLSCHPNPYQPSAEMERLVSTFFHQKGGNPHFWSCWKWNKTP